MTCVGPQQFVIFQQLTVSLLYLQTCYESTRTDKTLIIRPLLFYVAWKRLFSALSAGGSSHGILGTCQAFHVACFVSCCRSFVTSFLCLSTHQNGEAWATFTNIYDHFYKNFVEFYSYQKQQDRYSTKNTNNCNTKTHRKANRKRHSFLTSICCVDIRWEPPCKWKSVQNKSNIHFQWRACNQVLECVGCSVLSTVC